MNSLPAPSFPPAPQRGAILAFVIPLVVMTLSLCAADGPVPPGGKDPELRKPGFAFMILYTRRIAEYELFLQNVAGFKVEKKGPHFTALRTESARLLLNDPDILAPDHPFYQKLTGSGEGMGMEMCLVVADAVKACELAAKQPGWTIVAEAAVRPWGVRDFRVLSPDGHYLRISEPPP